MSVLQRRELEDSPLADLHAIASELGIEGYRALRREDLVAAILSAQGGEEPETEPVDAGAGLELEGPDGGRALSPDLDDVAAAEQEPEPEPETVAAAPEGDAADEVADGDRVTGTDAADEVARGETATGPLDILPNGSGFIRVGATGQSNDVYVSPAQIRRCELRAGDEVSGPVRPARRNERHPSLVRVSRVNGGDPEPPEERPDFTELTPVHPTERLPGPAALDALPIGKGSRVAVSGVPGAGATRLLRGIARAIADGGGDILLTVVLVGARPEEVTEWEREEGIAVAGGSFDRSLEAQTQAAELAIERAKRAVERGRDAVVVIDSLETLPPGPTRRLFGAARKAEEGGSLTVVAAVGSSPEPLRQASTRVRLDGAADEPTVIPALSGTQRADLLA